MTDTQRKYQVEIMDDHDIADYIVQPGILNPKPCPDNLIHLTGNHNAYIAWCNEKDIDLLWRGPLLKLIKLGVHPLFCCQGLDQGPDIKNETYITFLWDDTSPIGAVVDYLDKYLWYFLCSPHELNFERSKMFERSVVTPMSRRTDIWKSGLSIRYNPRVEVEQQLFFSALNYLLDRFIELGDVPPFTYNDDHRYHITNNVLHIEYGRIPLGTPEFIRALSHILIGNKITEFSTDDMTINTYLQMSGMFA